MAPHPRVTKSPSVCSLNDSAEVQTNGHAEESVDLDQLIFTPYHSGPAKQLEVKGLHPWTTYHFRVQVFLPNLFFVFCFIAHFHIRSSAMFSPFFSRQLMPSASAFSLQFLQWLHWHHLRHPFRVCGALPSRRPVSAFRGTFLIATARPSRTTTWKSVIGERSPPTRPQLPLTPIIWLPIPPTGRFRSINDYPISLALNFEYSSSAFCAMRHLQSSGSSS